MTGLISAGADLVTILYDITTGVGAFVLLCWTIGAIGWLIAARGERKRPMVAIPVTGWTDQLIADLGMCPWCQLRECGNPRLCTCEELCGMPLCRPLETETAP